MTTDSSGDFLIATGPIGSVLNGTSYGFEVVNSSITAIAPVPVSLNSLLNGWDIAVAPGQDLAYIAFPDSNVVATSTFSVPARPKPSNPGSTGDGSTDGGSTGGGSTGSTASTSTSARSGTAGAHASRHRHRWTDANEERHLFGHTRLERGARPLIRHEQRVLLGGSGSQEKQRSSSPRM